MSLNGNDTYLILNYSPSVVAISTRDTSYLIPGGRADAPATFPLTLNEIRYVNNISKAFKYGLLFFEDYVAEELYDDLHIHDWKSILRDDQIEAILTDPTVDGLERILAIPDQLYFERIYGIYIGMKNAGIPISSKVEGLLTTRRKELARGRTTTDLSVRKVPAISDRNDEIDALKAQVEQLTAMLVAQQKTETKNTTGSQASAVDVKPAASTSKAKKTTRSTTKEKVTSKQEGQA